MAIAGLITCLIALSAELTVHIAGHVASGGTVLGALLSFVSYYTVGSNILLAVVYAAHLSRSRALRILRDARVRTMAAAMITLVMLVYLFILSRVESPQGLGKISVILAHYVSPPIYLAWWAATSHRDNIGIRDLPYMVAPSIAYMAYVLLLGHLTGTYPYAMLDADRISTWGMVVHGMGLLLALLAACALFIALGRWRYVRVDRRRYGPSAQSTQDR
jgi:cobalamin synthase